MKQTLLIAEGDAELGDIFRRFLARRGFAVETAGDGLDCLDKLRLHQPAVLVLDQELRWGGGDGVLAWLREEGPRTGVAVILTTTAGSPANGPETPEPPVVKVLTKPFALTDLLESVRGVIGQAAPEETGTPNADDLRLAEQVERALHQSSYELLRRVEVIVREGRVSLKGKVPSYYLKQVAQAAVQAIPGDYLVCNDLEVGLHH